MRAYAYLTFVDLSQRVVGFERLMSRMPFPSDTTVRHTEQTHRQLERAQGYARWVDVASRHHVVRAQCLHRSLALALWLSRDDIENVVRIGVRKKGSELQAHAWVEVDGHVVNDEPAAIATFAVLNSGEAGDRRPFPVAALRRSWV
ncbi:MAG: hypothetical protein NVSMB2_06160 [Chloroflexota bacterium]